MNLARCRIFVSLSMAAVLGCATAAKIEDWDTSGTDIIDTAGDLSDTLSDTPIDGLPDTGLETPIDTSADSMGDTGPDLADTPTETTGGIVGDPCYSTTQCSGVPGTGRTCLTSLMGYVTFPGGYCSASCTSAADCGPGAQCVNVSDLGSYCLEQCTTAAQCRTAETYSCSAVPGASGTFCIPPISSPDS